MATFKRFIRPRGFTDKLYVTNFIITWVFVWLCYILTIFSGRLGITDMSVLSSAVPCAFAELGIHTGFVVWKAKIENVEKHKNDIDIFNVV